jgi:hypothetical protein
MHVDSVPAMIWFEDVTRKISSPLQMKLNTNKINKQGE